MRCGGACATDEDELGRQPASGECPCCGGKVEAIDVERRSWFYCLPLCLTIKRKYICSLCSKRLELNQ